MFASPALLIALLVAAGAFSCTMGVAALWTRQQPVILVGVPQATMPTSRDLALAKSWRDRLLLPLLQRLYGAGNALTPARNVEQLRRDLSKAGLFDSLTVLDFLGLRFLAAASLSGLVFVSTVFYRPLLFALLLAVAGFLIGLYLPNFWLRNRISKRQKAIMRSLPDALDRISICVDAGLGFEAAIQKVSAEWEGELAGELRHVIGEIRLGVPRVEALRHLADRTGVADVASFVAVLVQAERLGVAIRDVLHSQSVRMRDRRRQRAEEAANQAPIKMLIPLTLFIFPAMFAVILGPAIPQIMAAF